MANGLHNQIAPALAAQALAVVGGTAVVSTMRETFPGPASTVGGFPFTIIGPPKGRQVPASSETVLTARFPMRVYVAKVSSGLRAQFDINEWVDAFRAAWVTGCTLGSLVTFSWIESWDTDRWYTIGGEDYQAIDFVAGIETEIHETYTP